MNRAEYCVIGDDPASGALAAACSAAGPTVWLRGFEDDPLLTLGDFAFPLYPPLSFCAPAKEGFHPARGELRVTGGASDAGSHAWSLHGEWLAFLRSLEALYPDRSVALIDLYRRTDRHRPDFLSAASVVPEFLHPMGEALAMVYGHAPLSAIPFSSLAFSLRSMNPAMYSPRALLRDAEETVRERGSEVLDGVQVDSLAGRGRRVEIVGGDAWSARRVFLGNSEFLWRALSPFVSEVYPFVGYGVIKKGRTHLDFIWHRQDLDLPPIEKNFVFCAVLPWTRGESPYGDRRVIFGLNSSAYHWRKHADQKGASYRAFLEGWVAENNGDVGVLRWLTPPEAAVHP
ncbi:MAG: hypothetical protein ACREJQ_02580, partial [bacterium]